MQKSARIVLIRYTSLARRAHDGLMDGELEALYGDRRRVDPVDVQARAS
jgi:hypothetical protein